MNKFIEFAKKLNDTFAKKSMYLCELDSKVGDGDHGITIARGFETAYEKVCEIDETSKPSDYFRTIGYGMLESMGGASGPIFSTYFICMATVLRENEEICSETLVKGIQSAVKSVSDLAGTVRNEKTMVDAMFGALDEVENSPKDINSVLNSLCVGAKKGSDATIEMKATKGRAKFLGERSRGFRDAGSWSVYLIMNDLKDTFEVK